jgi:hypothetical protein
LHEISSTLIDYSPLPFPASVLNTVVLVSDLPFSPANAHLLPVSHGDDGVPLFPPNADGPDDTAPTSSCPILRADCKLTGGGEAYAESIQVAKAHLEKMRANKERWRQMREAGER